uniref:Uncharacterized protein n=1 Tax=Anopheles farauti TaxID=69004 RepID=A0A182Q0P4_9DIPT
MASRQAKAKPIASENNQHHQQQQQRPAGASRADLYKDCARWLIVETPRALKTSELINFTRSSGGGGGGLDEPQPVRPGPAVSTVGEEELLVFVRTAATIHGSGRTEHGTGDERWMTVEQGDPTTSRASARHPIPAMLVVRDGEVPVGDKLRLMRLLLPLGRL